jgi:primosomal protein N' (replication factor Y)
MARQERLLESMRLKTQRIQERLEKKQELAEKAKDGTKAKAKYIEDSKKIQEELDRATAALRDAETKAALTEYTSESTDTEAIKDVNLSEAQTQAYNHINESFNKKAPVLIQGVTGSGKTEIYIRLAWEAIEKGRNVLYLVPEIALSRQLEDRLSEHFGKRLLVFHSAETASSRRATAEAIRSGRGYIVLGTRSALFLPHHDLGLIVVDEEHDSSYKQDSPAPRYNGRDTALMLSTIHRCNIIMGSATPSLEEIYNCECGKHSLVRLEERYHGTEDSDIEIIDTKAERKKRGMVGNFSRKLISHIEKALKDGGQVMILRSRRAWSSAIQCTECGDIPKCPHCNVSLSLHKAGGIDRMVCHYCGRTFRYSATCVKCNGEMKSLGAGTQRIEEEAAALFPNARIARLDSDTAQNKTYEKQTIREFSKGGIDILIGTQMLTKGFDFGGLTLVAVIAADTFLGIQDFRADEKAAQILEQFRGRCGRRGRKGLTVIQTSQPEHPVYKSLISGKKTEGHLNLLQERKDFGFPPYTRIIEIAVRDNNEKRADLMVSVLSDRLRKSFDITGPYSPAVDKVADMHIRLIRVSLKKDRNLSLHKVRLMQEIRSFEKERKYEGHMTINVDPA